MLFIDEVCSQIGVEKAGYVRGYRDPRHITPQRYLDSCEADIFI